MSKLGRGARESLSDTLLVDTGDGQCGGEGPPGEAKAGNGKKRFPRTDRDGLSAVIGTTLLGTQRMLLGSCMAKVLAFLASEDDWVPG